MKDNPYSKMIEIIRDKGSSSNPPSIQIGEVVSPLPNLIVKIGDLQIDKDNILISDYLLKEDKYIREYKTSNDKVNWNDRRYVKYVDAIKVNDLLAVMPTESRQLYIVLARLKEVE